MKKIISDQTFNENRKHAKQKLWIPFTVEWVWKSEVGMQSQFRIRLTNSLEFSYDASYNIEGKN